MDMGQITLVPNTPKIADLVLDLCPKTGGPKKHPTDILWVNWLNEDE
jgi:hypothetical protein